MGDIPTISLDPSRSAEDIAKEIRAACLKNGFFQVTHYYQIVPRDLPGQTLAAAREFFNLPLAVKQELHKADHVAGGYEPYKIMNLNPSDSMGYGHNEGFSFAAEPSPTAWPSSADLPEFKQIMQSYYNAVTDLAKLLGRFLALGLNLSEDYFDSFYKDQLAHVKLAHYYRPKESNLNETNVGVAPHTDWGAITILLQDEVGGLEVLDQESAEWIKVRGMPQYPRDGLLNEAGATNTRCVCYQFGRSISSLDQ
jgi:isopenicillin N synthase-like dioxygenase